MDVMLCVMDISSLLNSVFYTIDFGSNVVSTQPGFGDVAQTKTLTIAVSSSVLVGGLLLVATAVIIVVVGVSLYIRKRRSPQGQGFTRLSTVRSTPVAV